MYLRSIKGAILLAAMLVASTAAVADGIDPIITPGRGPTGSPTLTPVVGLDVNNGVQFTEDFTVANGQTVVVESLIIPAADVAKGVTCGVSNAFLDGSPTSPAPLINLFGFAPVVNEDGTDTCNWYAFTGTNNDAANSTESVTQMELDCLATNYGLLKDPDDCAGIPGGTSNSDIVFTVINGVTGSAGDITANSTLVPEPNSAALLLFGLAALGILAYRRKQLA